MPRAEAQRQGQGKPTTSRHPGLHARPGRLDHRVLLAAAPVGRARMPCTGLRGREVLRYDAARKIAASGTAWRKLRHVAAVPRHPAAGASPIGSRRAPRPPPTRSCREAPRELARRRPASGSRCGCSPSESRNPASTLKTEDREAVERPHQVRGRAPPTRLRRTSGRRRLRHARRFNSGDPATSPRFCGRIGSMLDTHAVARSLTAADLHAGPGRRSDRCPFAQPSSMATTSRRTSSRPAKPSCGPRSRASTRGCRTRSRTSTRACRRR